MLYEVKYIIIKRGKNKKIEKYKEIIIYIIIIQLIK